MNYKNLTPDEFDPEKKNGVHLFGIKSEYEGYSIIGGRGSDLRTMAGRITINGAHIGANEYFEIECDDYEHDGETFNILIDPEE